LTDKVERGRSADQLLNPDGIFIECTTALEAEYIAKWRDATTLEDREEYHGLIRLMDRLKNDIRDIIVTGKIAEQEQLSLRDQING
jgi:hypothetical protein